MDRSERLELASNYFIKNSELVELKTGSYEEITTHADQRTVLFKVKAKDTWSSIPLISTLKKGFVPGLKQKLVRLYDCQREAFTFQNTRVGNRLNVSQVLRSQPIWDGRDLTSMDVLDLCDQFIDQVTKLLSLIHIFLSDVLFFLHFSVSTMLAIMLRQSASHCIHRILHLMSTSKLCQMD